MGSVERTIRYWWVNQNQTHRHEIGNGYLWSPKVNSNGAKSPFYDFMTEITPGDIVFSHVDGQILAVGVAESSTYTATKPLEFGKAGSGWAQIGWRVDVDFRIADSPISPKNHLALIWPLLPERYSPIQKSGRGNQAYLFSVSSELGQLLLDLLGVGELWWPAQNLDQLEYDEAEQEIILDASLLETTKRALVLSRRGQGKFRERVRNFERECRVTGVSAEQLLIASHIKPWKNSNNEERLSGNNGLFLSPHVDKLFDLGFITFENSGKLVSSPLLDVDVLDRWHIDPDTKVKPFDSVQSYFLEHHRKNVFRDA